jgi:two-component system OmpR family sensor kinase
MRRLFWKILIAFWLAMVATTTGILLSVASHTHDGLMRVLLHAYFFPYGPPFPFWPTVLHLLAGLLVSAVLAAYLARPIGHLRAGFRSLSEGNLDTRLTPRMGRRRDEIADLAGDFDAMAERLQLLVTSRERLLHDVSHELRSPLARLSVAVGLARRNGELSDQSFERITAETARLNAILDDLLSIARAEAEAEVAVEENYFDVGDLLRLVCADAGYEAQLRGVSVDLELGPEFHDPAHAPLISGAPELVRRAAENVVRNALRFTPDGGSVSVSANTRDEAVVIIVRDHGPGVAPSLLGQMFDPFVKGAGEAQGVGLGLAIARRAIAVHGGSLEAANADGGGLSMRLILPVSTTAAQERLDQET